MSRFNLCLVCRALLGLCLVTGSIGVTRAAEELLPPAPQPQAPQPTCTQCQKSQPQSRWFNATWFDSEGFDNESGCPSQRECPAVEQASGWQPRATAEVEREVHQILQIMNQLDQGVLAGTEFDESCCDSSEGEGTCCATKDGTCCANKEGTCCTSKERTSMANLLRQVAAERQQERAESPVCDATCDAPCPVQVLRQTSRELESLAGQLEEQDLYGASDTVRQMAASIRQQARELKDQRLAASQPQCDQRGAGRGTKTLHPLVSGLELELDVPR